LLYIKGCRVCRKRKPDESGYLLERPEILPDVRPFEPVSISGQTLLQFFSEHERQKTAKHMAGDILSPILLAKGIYVRLVTPKLPEPDGVHFGAEGAGKSLICTETPTIKTSCRTINCH